MKVVFSDSFKSEIERIDGNVIITKASLSYDSKVYTSRNTLATELLKFSGNDTQNYYNIIGIWDNLKKQFHISLDVPDDVVINRLASDDGISTSELFEEYNIVRFFWKDDQVAFTVIKDFIPGQVLSPIDLTQTKNLIVVQFPETTKSSNIHGLSEIENEDVTFLEGGGTQQGESIIRLYEELSEKESTVNKLSYDCFCFILSSEYSNEHNLPYLNTFGQKVTDHYTAKELKSLELSFPGMIDVDGELKVYGLNNKGGSIHYYGTVTYDEYLYTDGKKTLLEKDKSAPLNSFMGIELVCLDSDSDFTISEINNYSRFIKFEERVESEDTVSVNNARFQLIGHDSEGNIIESNIVRLIQGDKEEDWKVIVDSKFIDNTTDKDIPVLVFEGDEFGADCRKEIKILSLYNDTISWSSSEHFHKVDGNWNLVDGTEITSEIFGIREKVVSGRAATQSLTLEISPLAINEADGFVPALDGNSQLCSKITIKTLRHTAEILVVQKKNLSRPELYAVKKEGTEWKINGSEILNLGVRAEFQYANGGTTGYYTVKGENDGRTKWAIVGKNSLIQLEARLNSITETTIVPEGQVLKLYLKNTIESAAIDLDLGPFYIYQYPSKLGALNIETNTDWRNDIEISKKKIFPYIPAVSPNATITLRSDSGNSIINEIGLYKVTVKSNYIFDLNFNTSIEGVNIIEGWELWKDEDDFYKNYINKEITATLRVDKIPSAAVTVQAKGTTVGLFSETFSVGYKNIPITGFGKTALVPVSSSASPVSKTYENYGYIFTGIPEVINANSIPSVTVDSHRGDDYKDRLSFEPEFTDLEYTYKKVSSLRPNIKVCYKESETDRDIKNVFYPVKSANIYKLDTRRGAGNNRATITLIAIDRNYIQQPEIKILDNEGNQINKTIYISPIGNTSFTLLSSYKLPDVMKLNVENTNLESISGNYSIISTISLGVSITEEGLDENGWNKYRLTLNRTGLKVSDTSNSNKMRIGFKPFLPASNIKAIGGETIIGGISGILNQESLGVTTYKLPENYYTQQEIDEITESKLTCFDVVEDPKIIFPNGTNGNLGNTKFYLLGDNNVSYLSTDNSNITYSARSIEEIQTDDNTFTITGSLIGYESFSRKDNTTYTLNIEPRYKPDFINVTALSTSALCSKFIELGKPKELSASFKITTDSGTDTFTIKNTQEGIENSLVFMNPGEANAKVYVERRRGSISRTPVLLEKLLKQSDTINYIDVIIGVTHPSAIKEVDGMIIDFNELEVEGELDNLVLEPLGDGVTVYNGNKTKPNLRIHIANKTFNEELVFKSETSKEGVVIGRIVIKREESYPYNILGPSDACFSNDGILVPGAGINGISLVINSNCADFLRSSDKVYSDLLSYELTGDIKLQSLNDSGRFPINRIRKIKEASGNIEYSLDITAEENVTELEELTGTLKLSSGTSDYSVKLKQGTFTPYIIVGTEKEVLSGEHTITLKDINNVTIDTSPLSIEILDIDYTYSNSSYTTITKVIDSESSLNSLIRIKSNIWTVKENGEDVNLSDYINDYGIYLARNNAKMNLVFYYVVDYSKKSNNFEIEIDLVFELKRSISSPWFEGADISEYNGSSSFVHSKLKINRN